VNHQPIKHTTMTCLDCGYALDGLRSTACPECGRAFQRDDRASYHRVIDDPVRFARLPIAKAMGVCMALEEAGIHCGVEMEQGGIIGHVDLPQAALWVSRTNESRAREHLSRYGSGEDAARAAWTCAACREEIEAAFDVCWNCGNERGGAAVA
jgi:hypothetical protein